MKELKAALYVRVSTLHQIDKDSLPLQREDLTNYAKLVLGINDFVIFEDAGYSAKNTERPAFQEMMGRLRLGEFTHVLVWKIDRISRNLLDFSQMYAELKRLGVTFVSKNEQFDTSSAMGEAMLKIILVFAELERNMTSERVTATMISRASNGNWNGGRIPYGYDYDKETTTFSINEAEANIVQLIFDMYEEQESLLYIARRLNEAGIRTKRGNEWNPVSISKILKNPFYTGSYRYNYHDESKSGGNTSSKHIKDKSEWILIENHHPLIIDEDRQNHVIHVLNGNFTRKAKDSRTTVKTHAHIFAGLIYCGNCGSLYTAGKDRTRSNGYSPSTYGCSGRRKHSECQNKFVSEITLVPFIFSYISNMLSAKSKFTQKTSLQRFEKMLLSGSQFDDVESIERTGLIASYTMLKTDVSGDLYSPTIEKADERMPEEYNLLLTERKKQERALSRLRSLYLYDEADAISERDYVLAKNDIEAAISKIDERISELETKANLSNTISDDEFIVQATAFLIAANITSNKKDFTKLVQNGDELTIKNFISSIISRIVVLDGKVQSITFSNGIRHEFIRKSSTD